MTDKPTIWDLREIINKVGYEDTFQYMINDFQKVNYGQPELFLQSEEGRIFAFIRSNEEEICIREIETEEQLRKLIEALK